MLFRNQEIQDVVRKCVVSGITKLYSFLNEHDLQDKMEHIYSIY